MLTREFGEVQDRREKKKQRERKERKKGPR